MKHNTTTDIVATTTITSVITGTGEYDAFPIGTPIETLTFLHGVSVGQTIMVGGETWGAGANLQINDPKDFHATIHEGSLGHVLLEGIKASSYSLSGSALTLFSGNKIVDTVQLIYGNVNKNNAMEIFNPGVCQMAGAIDIYNGSPMPGFTALLPGHS
jgi:hypothetical protein